MSPYAVVQAPVDTSAGTLVGVAEFARDARGPPLAVGRMAIDADKIDNGVTKGKAVIVLHTWKDHLWAIGSQGDPPEAVSVAAAGVEAAGGGDQEKDGCADGSHESTNPPPATRPDPAEHPPAEAPGGPVSEVEEKLTPEGNVSSASWTLRSIL